MALQPTSTHAHDDTDDGGPSGTGPRKAKRRRATNGEKKFICDEPGCNKELVVTKDDSVTLGFGERGTTSTTPDERTPNHTFSRPDHLSRHKLNHNPTTTYHCSHAGCPKTFVRLDLLVRHEERHERKLDPEKMAAHKARQTAAQNRATNIGKQEGHSDTSPQSALSNPTDSTSFGLSPQQQQQQQLAQQQQQQQATAGMQPTFSFGNSVGQMTVNMPQHQVPFQQRMFGLPDAFGASTSAAAFGMTAPTTSDAMTQQFQQQQQQQQQQHQNQQKVMQSNTNGTSMFPGNLGGFQPDPSGSAGGMQQPLFAADSGVSIQRAIQQQQEQAQRQQQQHFSTMSDAGQSQTGSIGPRTDSLDFVQASYGAPFVSASEYDWLFDPTGGFDVSLPASRPASPFGTVNNNGVDQATNMTTSGVNLDLSSFTNGMNLAQGHLNGLANNNNTNQMNDLPRTFGFAHGGFAPLPQWGPIQEESEPGSQQASPAQSLNAPSVNSQQSQIPSPAHHQHPSPAQAQQPSPLGQASSPVGPPQQPLQPTASRAPASEHARQHQQLQPLQQQNNMTAAREPSKEKLKPTSPVQKPRPKPPPAVEKLQQTTKPRVQPLANEAHSNPYPLDDNTDKSVFIENETRSRVIDYLGNDFRHLRSDNRMSRTAMMEYLELFWSRVHETQAPAVHRASFVAANAPAPLLLSMMLLGCYFASDKAFKLAGQLHPVFRGKVLCSPDFRPRAENWLHQTVLLIIVFGKLCSTRADHEMAHIFWSSCVTLGRRSAIFSQRPNPVFAPGNDDLETQWAAWIDEEVAKRVALIMFGVDVEHAAFFRHSPTLSAFQVQLQLPCDEELWEARTAEEWARIRINSRPSIPFISALKASLTAGNASPALNPFSRIAILHGLLSVAQDLQWRDHVIGLSQPEGRANNWRDMISAAYNSWKSRLDTSLVSATFPTSQLLRASISLYAVAHITLSIDIHELQIYAGAPQALGLIVTAAIYNATEARIKIWAQTKVSKRRHLLRMLEPLAGTPPSFCVRRCSIFNKRTLTWLDVYTIVASGEPGPASSEAEYQKRAMTWLDSMCTHSPEALVDVPRKNESLDLCRVVCEYIEGSRWEIAREGARILKKLQTQNPGPP
ncbi:hypothetical protein OIO90_003765 [Microbotryomycetes sp. JL221]|nr:hypothetical protein OIO90_003765 [Microbotryomycetes sp. JL221]